LSKAFSLSIEMIVWVLSFILLMCCIMLIDLHMLNHPYMPRMKSTWSWDMIFLMDCWIQFASILLRTLCLCPARKLVYNFLFCCTLLWFWYQGSTDFIEWVWYQGSTGFIESFCILWNSLRSIGVSSSLKVW
jgi:hypothetical protein